MRAAALLLALFLAGCAERSVSSTTFHQVHDFAGPPRETPLRVGDHDDELQVRLRLVPAEGVEACVASGARVLLLQPDGSEAAGLAAAPECAGAEERWALVARPGTWRVAFEGNGTLVGVADVRIVDHSGGGGARVPAR